MARGLRRPTPHTPPALRASYLLKEACFQATPNPRPAMSAQGYLDACLGPATHRLYLGCWRGARGGSAQLPCFCVGGRAFCVSSPQTRQANSELRQKRSRPQSTLQPASSGVFLILLAARYLAQLMWAAAEAAATWMWVLQPLRGSRGEKTTNQAWTSAPRVQSSKNSAFEARSTRWPLIFRARRSDETHQQATAPSPCTGGRATRRRRCPAAHPR